MSAPHEPAKPSPGPSGGRTAATFLLILVGVGLLLPGLCSLAVIVILLGIEPRDHRAPIAALDVAHPSLGE